MAHRNGMDPAVFDLAIASGFVIALFCWWPSLLVVAVLSFVVMIAIALGTGVVINFLACVAIVYCLMVLAVFLAARRRYSRRRARL